MCIRDRVLILTFWHPVYTGSSVEGYAYMALEYDDSGNFIYSTEIFSFDDKNAGDVYKRQPVLRLWRNV